MHYSAKHGFAAQWQKKSFLVLITENKNKGIAHSFIYVCHKVSVSS